MLEAKGLSHGFGKRVLYRELNLQISAGECWALLGLNGSGKTTLLHCLAGLVSPDRGEVHLHGQPLTRLGRRNTARQIGLLLQHQRDEFPVTVLETLLTGRYPHNGIWGWESSNDRQRALALLEQLDLEQFRQRLTDTLSGGERRRLAVAQLLLQDPGIALLDEPDSQLDPCRKTALVGLLAERFGGTKRVCLMSLHDINLAQCHCSHVLMLYGNGDWCAGPIGEMLTRQRLEQLYGCQVSQLERPAGPLFLPGY